MKNRKANKEADNGYALRKGTGYGTANFWALKVFYNNRFYMTYVANENIAIAESKTPVGSFSKRLNNLWQLR